MTAVYTAPLIMTGTQRLGKELQSTHRCHPMHFALMWETAVQYTVARRLAQICAAQLPHLLSVKDFNSEHA